jgi:hypothetical protein
MNMSETDMQHSMSIIMLVSPFHEEMKVSQGTVRRPHYEAIFEEEFLFWSGHNDGYKQRSNVMALE